MRPGTAAGSREMIRFLAEAEDVVLHLAFDRLHHFLDAGGMDSAVVHEPLQRHFGDLATKGIKP